MASPGRFSSFLASVQGRTRTGGVTVASVWRYPLCDRCQGSESHVTPFVVAQLEPARLQALDAKSRLQHARFLFFTAFVKLPTTLICCKHGNHTPCLTSPQGNLRTAWSCSLSQQSEITGNGADVYIYLDHMSGMQP